MSGVGEVGIGEVGIGEVGIGGVLVSAVTVVRELRRRADGSCENTSWEASMMGLDCVVVTLPVDRPSELVDDEEASPRMT